MILRVESLSWKKVYLLVSRNAIEFYEFVKKDFKQLVIFNILLLGIYYVGYQAIYGNNFTQSNPISLDLISSASNPSQSKKIAFLYSIQSALPLAPLWAKFFKSHANFYTVYINLNPGHSLDLPEQFSGAIYSAQDTSSGDVSLLEAELLMFSSALQNRANEWFILLSEYCIPLYNFDYFYSFLSKSTLNYVNIITDETQSSISRYSNEFWPEIPREAWTKGSPWFELNRDTVMKVLMDKIYVTKFRLLCHPSSSPSCFSSEHYVQTFMRITAPQLLANHSLTWDDWSDCGNCYGPREYSFINKMIIDKARSEKCMLEGVEYPCFLIARMFNEKSLPDLLHFALYLGY